MLFNSFNFLIFFPLVLIIYYIIPKKARWVFLLLVSYFFYMNWEPIYALLILTSTIITFVGSKVIYNSSSQSLRKLCLVICLIINFGILFLFKYYNFVTKFLYDLLEFLNLRIHFPEFKFLLPVGISFYTFQAVSYLIDVYKKDLHPEKQFGRYALFVAFFPQLVAGPIERAKSLLPQLRNDISFNYSKAVEGIKLIIWGYFMKVVVADRLALYVNIVYDEPELHSSITYIVASVFFAFQIYCDFGGYSNIAIGTAKIMGFDLMTNFRRPYFAQNVSEFWRRWHISLSTWFRDYLYIPLGGNRKNRKRKNFNLFVTFLISGIWHGANWTFVFWGAINGIYQILNSYIKLNLRLLNFSILRMLITFILIDFTWIFFRANSLSDAFLIIKSIYQNNGPIFIENKASFMYGLIGLIILIFKDFYNEFSHSIKPNILIKYMWYSLIVILILLIGVFDESQFIYFQF